MDNINYDVRCINFTIFNKTFSVKTSTKVILKHLQNFNLT